jgi:hypothetical protein
VSELKRCYVCGRLVPRAVTLTLTSQEEDEALPALSIEVNLCPSCAKRWARELLEAAEAAEKAGESGESGEEVAARAIAS